MKKTLTKKTGIIIAVLFFHLFSLIFFYIKNHYDQSNVSWLIGPDPRLHFPRLFWSYFFISNILMVLMIQKFRKFAKTHPLNDNLVLGMPLLAILINVLIYYALSFLLTYLIPWN